MTMYRVHYYSHSLDSHPIRQSPTGLAAPCTPATLLSRMGYAQWWGLLNGCVGIVIPYHSLLSLIVPPSSLSQLTIHMDFGREGAH